MLLLAFWQEINELERRLDVACDFRIDVYMFC